MSDPRRVAVVTGAAGALGSEMVRRFLADGLRVVAADVNAEGARSVAREADPDGGSALGVEVDVTDYGSVEAMIRSAAEWGGAVDVLVNNAGVSEGVVPTWELPLEAWHRTIEIDLTGVFHGCRAALPGMIERRWGRIVNISSIAGKEGKHNPAAYAAAKAGVIGMTKSIAFEVAQYGVLVNAVAPGSIFTHNWAGMSDEEIEVVRLRHPIGRLGRPAEVAALVSWLGSDECSFSTGAIFDISGGRASH
jgi:NAD(P)-dependent dehydrogenase (short-subunit alcohol dehydrogenase family)